MRSPSISPKTLLVEGKDDAIVVANLCKVTGFPDNAFQIKEKDGYGKLRDSIEVELDDSNLQFLGILVDADLDVQSRWGSLRDRLLAAGYNNLPRQPAPDGIIVTQARRPTVGVWIMPDNTLPGELEDFLPYLIPATNTLWPRAKDCVKSIPTPERLFSAGDASKAYIHTWLAWQKQPGRPFGQAITNEWLKPGAPQASRFMDWLRRLFQV